MNNAIGADERSKRNKRISGYYWGTAYDELPSHFSEDEGLKLRDRRPSWQSLLIRKTVDQVTSYLFGVDSRPMFGLKELTDEDGEILELSDDLTAQINAEVSKIRRWSQLDKYLSEIARLGLLNGTVGLAGHIYEDSLIWCEILELNDFAVKYARDDRAAAAAAGLQEDDVLELDEFWLEVEFDEEGERTEYAHRRLWTTTQTLEFARLELDEEPASIKALQALAWVEDPALSVTHDLGFVPVVIIRNAMIANSDYGAPFILEALADLEDECNYTRTSAGRSVRYNCEPQIYTIDAVNAAYNETIAAGADRTLNVQSGEQQQASIGILEMSGSAHGAAVEYTQGLIKSFEQITGVMQHDPERFVGALSGTALERLLQPMVMLIGKLREQYGAGLARWFELMLRARGVDGAENITIGATWPAVIPPTLEDLSLIGPLIVQLYTSGIIPLELALEILAKHLGIEDPSQYVQEQEAAAASQLNAGTNGAATRLTQ